MNQQQRMVDLLETYFTHACQLLRHGDSGDAAVRRARAWLTRRGVEPDRLDRLPVGVVPDVATMETELREAGFHPAEIEASNLLADARLSGRLVGAIRDPRSQIVSFWARHPEGRPPKYLIKGPWKDAISVFGLDIALPAINGGPGGLVLIDDLLDAVLLHQLGLLPVAAIGGSGFQMTPARWQRLAELGVSRVALVLRGPDAGEEASAAVEAARIAEWAPHVYVVAPDRFAAAGGLLKWVRWHGCEAVHDAIWSPRPPAPNEPEPTMVEPPEEIAVDVLPEPPDIADSLPDPLQPSGPTISQEPEDPPRANPRGRRGPDGYCELHRCDITDCFCFD